MPLAQLGVARATTQQIENQGIKQKRKTKMETPGPLMTAPRPPYEEARSRQHHRQQRRPVPHLG
jgi:hypothetical protein